MEKVGVPQCTFEDILGKSGVPSQKVGVKDSKYGVNESPVKSQNSCCNESDNRIKSPQPHVKLIFLTFSEYNKNSQQMPSSYLACNESMEPVVPLSCGLIAEAGGGRMIFVRIHGCLSLYDFVY